MAVLVFITTPGEIPTHIVLPQACLMAAEGSEPDGITEDHDASGPGNAEHLPTHPPRIGNMFCDIAGIHHIEDGLPEWQVHT